MWFFNTNKSNLTKLEDKVADLENKLNQRYEEYDTMNESLNAICKELREFLTEENNITEHDFQTEQNSASSTRQN